MIRITRRCEALYPQKSPHCSSECFSGTSFVGRPADGPDAVRLRLRASGSCRPRSSILFRFGSSPPSSFGSYFSWCVTVSTIIRAVRTRPWNGRATNGQIRPFRPPSKNASRREPDPARNALGAGSCAPVWSSRAAALVEDIVCNGHEPDSVRGPLPSSSGASDLRVPASSPSVPDGARSGAK